MNSRQAIDIHIHLPGKGPQSGCRMSFRLGLGWRFLKGGVFRPLDDDSLKNHVLSPLKAARQLAGAVLLALDRVHDSNGKPLDEQTHLHIPDHYVARVCKEENPGSGPRLMWGASIHPDRPDAVDALDEAAQKGAVLVKWIPATQNIDPWARRHKKFYQKLIDLSLPLLCHAGREHSIPVPRVARPAFRHWESPLRLARALELGVTVIGAHCAAPVFPWEPGYHREFIVLMDKAQKHGWRLFGDVSAFTIPSPFRLRCIKRIRDHIPHDRLILGSDFPVPVTNLWEGAVRDGDVRAFRAAKKKKNPFDRNVDMIRALGFDEQVLTNAKKILCMTGNNP